MRATIENFQTGWFGITLEIGEAEIEVLIDRLTKLRGGDLAHFHLRCDDLRGNGGVADVGISLKRPEDPDNLVIE